jgi:hypothetical protein
MIRHRGCSCFSLSQHPLFQTFFLPLLLAVLGMAAMRLGPGERWAGLGAMLGLLGALAWFPGFDWPAHSRTQKLPWVVLAGIGVAVLVAVLATVRDPDGAQPVWTLLAAQATWAGAVGWLASGQAGGPWLAGFALLGGAVLWRVVSGNSRAPRSANRLGLTVQAIAALGLAVLAATGGSLLLAQLAGMLACTAAALAGWVWLRPAALKAGAAAGQMIWPMALAWLSIAWAWVLAEPAAGPLRALQVALLALTFVVPALLHRLAAALLLAALTVVLAWWVGTALIPMPDTAPDSNDPYLTS